MARRTGKMTIIYLMRKLCRLVNQYGVGAVITYTGSANIGSALNALAQACRTWEQADNYPGEIDLSAPQGPEDVAFGGGS